MVNNKNKLDGTLVFASFESHLMYVLLNSWWIDITACIHVTSLLHGFEGGES